MDEAKRVELYKQAETLLFEEGPLCPVVNEAANTFRYTYIKNANTMPFTSTGLKYAYVSGPVKQKEHKSIFSLLCRRRKQAALAACFLSILRTKGKKGEKHV